MSVKWLARGNIHYCVGLITQSEGKGIFFEFFVKFLTSGVEESKNLAISLPPAGLLYEVLCQQQVSVFTCQTLFVFTLRTYDCACRQECYMDPIGIKQCGEFCSLNPTYCCFCTALE